MRREEAGIRVPHKLVTGIFAHVPADLEDDSWEDRSRDEARAEP